MYEQFRTQQEGGGLVEMSETSEFEREYNSRELTGISGKPQNIEIAALKTLEAYKKEYAIHGVVPTGKDDYPRSDVGYRQVQKLLEFDRIVRPEKGIKLKIHTMTVQPITLENGETKHAIYYSGQYEGYDAWDNEIHCSVNTGYFYSPKMRGEVVNTGITIHDFDEAGERRRIWKAVGHKFEHYLFLEQNPKQRKIQLEKLFKDAGSNPQHCVFNFRQSNPDNNHASKHGPISWTQFCDLTFQQMAELQDKRYYSDDKGASPEFSTPSCNNALKESPLNGLLF